ncbi:MAG: glycosyltransferase [Terriglobia bacterium]|jgi:glycosyltransferase involved in cell wall biosynthesis
MNSKRTIIVYRDELLGVSETFIRAQAESLRRFHSFFVGLRHRAGLSLPENRVHVISPPGLVGKFQRARFKLLGPSLSLRRSLARKQPALIHAHFGPDACNAMALADALNVPLIVSLHGYDITRSDDRQSRLYLRRRDRLMNKAARFICVSNFMREQAMAKGFPASKTVVHYTGIDTDFFHPNPQTARVPVVLFVGRLVQEKGCTYLIRAMARVQKFVPEARLVIIGDGPLREDLRLQAARTLKNYHFLGAQSAEIVRHWMNRATVFCTPSVMEGFGMVFAEAQAMGLPIAGFETGGVPEAVAHGETGFLVATRDWQELASKLVMLLKAPDLWARFSRAGELRVRRLFDIHKQAAALEEIYEEVLGDWHQVTARKRSSRPQELLSGGGDSKSPGVVLPSSEPGIEISLGSIR